MNFATAMKNESTKTFTENGALARNTSGDALLDFFSMAGSLRDADKNRIHTLFSEAYAENPLLAAKAMFYVRDVRGGLGERSTFRTLLTYVGKHFPEAIKKNIPLIGFYGRFDDLYALVGTSVEGDMWAYVSDLLAKDRAAMAKNEACSLLAKWLKTPDASSKETRRLGILTANKLGMTVIEYKHILRVLRKYIDVTEVHMTAKDWQNIKYSAVPSHAMMLYRNAFIDHDPAGYESYMSAVEAGTEKINASTLYPYDIVEKYDNTPLGFYINGLNPKYDAVLEAQWKALPNYVGKDANAIVIADTSGSMEGRPLYSAVALAIYFAERNKGAYHNLWMSFSVDSKVQHLKGKTLAEKLHSIDTTHWDGNTNLESAFMQILDIAVKNSVPNEEMVKSIIVISDMEIDYCTNSWSFYEEMKRRYEAQGYTIPNVVFWNVNSRHNIFHADKDRAGVQLCSGQSAATFKTLMESVGSTPVEMMMKVLESERYSAIVIDR